MKELISAFTSLSNGKGHVFSNSMSTGQNGFLPLSCPHRVEAQASLAGGGPEGLVSLEEQDVEEPEARTA